MGRARGPVDVVEGDTPASEAGPGEAEDAAAPVEAPEPHGPAEPPEPRWPAVVAIVVTLATGVALRVFVLRSALGVPDFDEATVGVQARLFSEGTLDAFFPNQPYGGTLETGLVTVVFALFGRSTFTLKVVPMALALLAAYLAWRVAKRIVPGRLGQWAVPALLWCAPAAGVLQSTKERGFYGTALVLSVAAVLLVLRLAEDVTRRDMALLGLVIGLGWWSTPLVMLVAVPAVVWLVVRRPAVVRAALPAVGCALVGALPWLAWNARNEWASLDAVPTLETTWPERLGNWFTRLPVAGGLAAPWAPDRQLLPWPLAARALVLAVVVAAGVRTWRRAPGLLPALVVGYALLYACNGLAVGAGPDPRYMYLLMPILVVAVAALLPDPASVAGRLAGVLVAVGVAGGLSLWLLWGTRDVATPHDAPKYINSQGVQRVAELLDERDVGTAITDSSGMQISFFTDGRVRAASFDVPRMRADERAARADRTTTYVLDAGEYGNADHLEFWLQLNGVDYERHDIGRWRVFLLDEQVLPHEAGLRTFAGHD